MDTSSSRQELIETRERELDKLQIVLSLKRTRDLEEDAERLKKQQGKKKKIIMEKLFHEIKPTIQQYTKMRFKDKIKFYLTANSIINLSSCSMYETLDEKKWSKYVNKNTSSSYATEQIEGTNIIFDHLQYLNNFIDRTSYLNFCTKIIATAKSDDELKLFRIYGDILQLFAFKQRELNRWKRMSEADVYNTFWGPILNTVFEDSPVIITRGETENSESKVSSVRTCDEKGPFKVDLRATLEHTFDDNPKVIKQLDVANCEVAKSGKIEKKNHTDNAKLIVEGKIILDSISKKCNLTFNEAKKLKIVNLQISGLKAILIQIKYAKDQNGYVAQVIGDTIFFPVAPKYIKNFFETGLPHLYSWKNRTEKNLKTLQDGLNCDNSLFGDSRCMEKQSFIKPTWYGPKTSRCNTPPLPDLNFNQ